MIIIVSIEVVSSFVPERRQQNCFPLQSLVGVREFEQWFKNGNGECKRGMEHSQFGSLRGLSWNGPSMQPNTQVATIPAKLVLQSDFNDDNWDTNLACQLWEEMKKGSNGYVSLLTQGELISQPFLLGSVAPHALRRWSQAERNLLRVSSKGSRLLTVVDEQERKWESKYSKISNKMSLEQFRWCMEAVHSRAFCGVATDSGNTVAALAAPLLASGAGLLYSRQADASYTGFGALAALAVLPLVMDLIRPSPTAAILLPLVDSANHSEEADSSIEFNAIKQVFELKVGPNCVVRDEGSGRDQLFISYGKKSDSELLLNYGFLPEVPVVSDGDEQRRLLAQGFIERNP